jgi:hypothetical protein
MWEVRDLNQLVDTALRVHIEEIESLEDALPDESALKAVMPRKAQKPKVELIRPRAKRS